MSIAVLKKKAFTNNPREAPLSGRTGFSLHGTLRGNYIGEGNLAFRNKHKNKTGVAYSTAVCNNDPAVLKTTVMNTRGMLSKKLKGIERIYSLAPLRENYENEENIPDDIRFYSKQTFTAYLRQDTREKLGEQCSWIREFH